MRAVRGNVSELFVSFQGEGVHAGRRQLFVRLGGCPLRCRYCDEPESLVAVPECRILGPDGMRRRANPFSPTALDAEVTALAAAAPPLHAIAVTGGEPLAQADFLASWLALRTNTLPVLLETAGILPARLARVLPWVAIVSFDVKCPSNTGERARWDEHDACFRMAVAAGREVYVKMPVDEGTAPEEVDRGAHPSRRAGAPAAPQGARHPVTARRRPGAPRPATLIPGDGIGPEVIDAAIRVLAAAGGRIAWDVQLAGKAAFEKTGTAIPEALLASIRRTHVGLKGPLETQIGRTGYRSVNVALRKTFDLFANVRPIQSRPGVRTAFSGVDLVVVRENTEDLYSGIEHTIAPGVVESVKVITARASRRIARFAFDLSRREHRRKVVAIHKANIMKLSDGLFLACARQVAKHHPRIRYEELIVDNACLQLVRRPQTFDVLLLENLYGDIVSDLCAGLVGGLGLVRAANLGATHAIFEAVHGSAPDIAGRNIANPTALMQSAVLMLLHLGEPEAASRLGQAVQRVLRERRHRTRDLGGTATTSAVRDRLIALL